MIDSLFRLTIDEFTTFHHDILSVIDLSSIILSNNSSNIIEQPFSEIIG